LTSSRFFFKLSFDFCHFKFRFAAPLPISKEADNITKATTGLVTFFLKKKEEKP
jgi:hypothetical protein